MIRQHFESGGNSRGSAMRINKDESLAIKLVVRSPGYHWYRARIMDRPSDLHFFLLFLLLLLLLFFANTHARKQQRTKTTSYEKQSFVLLPGSRIYK